MVAYSKAYQLLGERLEEQGLNIEEVKETLKNQKIETPSWGYANSGTRFKTFPWEGAAVSTNEKIDDAAMVHKMTGVAPSVALHIPWDKPDDGDYVGLRQYAESQGLKLGAINPNVFQDNNYKLGSLSNPSEAVREQALEHFADCCNIMEKTNSDVLSLWFADGTNYAGQDSLRGRKRRMEDGLKKVYSMLPNENSRMFVEYKFFEPAFYSTDLPDWGTSLAMCNKLGEQAQVLVDLGHHAQSVNIEQIVAFLLDEGKLGGFHFNNRKYADDDLMVGSVNPYELFLIYNELTSAAKSSDQPASATANKIEYMIDQSHVIEGKIMPMIQSIMNCQTAYAKSLLVNTAKLTDAQLSGDVIEAHRIINSAHNIDVNPILEQVRKEINCPIDPIVGYRETGYEEKIRKERGSVSINGGYQ